MLVVFPVLLPLLVFLPLYISGGANMKIQLSVDIYLRKFVDHEVYESR